MCLRLNIGNTDESYNGVYTLDITNFTGKINNGELFGEKYFIYKLTKNGIKLFSYYRDNSNKFPYLLHYSNFGIGIIPQNYCDQTIVIAKDNYTKGVTIPNLGMHFSYRPEYPEDDCFSFFEDYINFIGDDGEFFVQNDNYSTIILPVFSKERDIQLFGEEDVITKKLYIPNIELYKKFILHSQYTGINNMKDYNNSSYTIYENIFKSLFKRGKI